MKNTFGESVSVTLFGESHGKAVGAVLDGLAPGIPVDEAFIHIKWPSEARSLPCPPQDAKVTPSPF